MCSSLAQSGQVSAIDLAGSNDQLVTVTSRYSDATSARDNGDYLELNCSGRILVMASEAASPSMGAHWGLVLLPSDMSDRQAQDFFAPARPIVESIALIRCSSRRGHIALLRCRDPPDLASVCELFQQQQFAPQLIDSCSILPVAFLHVFDSSRLPTSLKFIP